MRPGDVVLVRLPRASPAPPKLRPALVLALLPGPYQSLLLCGISTQLHQQQANWDEPIQSGGSDFAASGLRRASLIRLSYLHAADPAEIVGTIGQIDGARLDRLRKRLADHLHP